MKIYKIHIHSQVTFFVIMMAIILPGMFTLATYLSKDINRIILFVACTGVLALAIYLASRFSMVKVKIELDESGFKHEWTKKFLFSRESDIHLSWDQILDYFFEEDRSFDKFQITLPNKQLYRFHRQNLWPMKDDFDKFQRDFPRQIRKIESASEQNIIRGKTIYEEKGFKWVLIVMSIFVGLLFLNAMFNESTTTNWGIIGMLAAAVGFYWIRVRMKREKTEHNRQYTPLKNGVYCSRWQYLKENKKCQKK